MQDIDISYMVASEILGYDKVEKSCGQIFGYQGEESPREEHELPNFTRSEEGALQVLHTMRGKGFQVCIQDAPDGGNDGWIVEFFTEREPGQMPDHHGEAQARGLARAISLAALEAFDVSVEDG